MRRLSAVGREVGLVNRPAATVGIVFEKDVDIGVIKLVGGQDAKSVVDLEEDDRGHEGAGEVPGGLLCEGEIVGHLRAPSWSGPIPARWLRQCAAAGAITVKAQPNGRSLLADLHGLIVEDASPHQESHHERAGLERWRRGPTQRCPVVDAGVPAGRVLYV